MFILDDILSSKKQYLKYQKPYYSLLLYKIQKNNLYIRNISPNNIIDTEWFKSNIFLEFSRITNHISNIRNVYLNTCYEILKIFYLILGEDSHYFFKIDIENTSLIQHLSLDIKMLIFSKIILIDKSIFSQSFTKVNKRMNMLYNNT